MSIRDKIFQADDIQSERVEIPEWDVSVDVRTMTGSERARIMQVAAENGRIDFERVFPDVVIACTYDPDTSERIFGYEDRDLLMAKSGLAIDRIAQVGLRLSGFTEQAAKDLGKGSLSIPNDELISS
jgi:hypothetical protein